MDVWRVEKWHLVNKVMITETIVSITYFSIAVSVFWIIWNFRHLRLEFQVLAAFVFLSAAVQATAEILAQFGINNMPVSHAYALFGFLLITSFFRFILKPFIPSKVFTVLGIIFLLLAVVNSLFWQPIVEFNSIPLVIEALIIMVFSISTFILTLNEGQNEYIRPLLVSLNWVNSGLFVYFFGSLILFYNGHVIIHEASKYLSQYTWLAHSMLTVILHTCLLMGLWKSPKK